MVPALAAPTPYLSLSHSEVSHATRKLLFLQLGFNQLVYAVLDDVANRFIQFGDFHFEAEHQTELSELVEAIIESEKLATEQFSKVNISFVNDRYSVVPSTLFDEEYINQIHLFNHSNQKDEEVNFDYLSENKTYCVYGIPRGILSMLYKHFPGLSYQHHSSVFLESALLLNNLHQQKKYDLLVNLERFAMDIALYNKHALSYYNQFDYSSKEDVGFYLFKVLEKLNIAADECRVLLLGQIEKESEIYDLLKAYLPNLEFASGSPILKYSSLFERIPNHFYYKLFNQYLCV